MTIFISAPIDDMDLDEFPFISYVKVPNINGYATDDTDVYAFDDNHYYCTSELREVVINGLTELSKLNNNETSIYEILSHWFITPRSKHHILEHEFWPIPNYEMPSILGTLKDKMDVAFTQFLTRDPTPTDYHFALQCSLYNDQYLIHDFDQTEYTGDTFIDIVKEMCQRKSVVGKCVCCGEPVYALGEHTLDHAGTITMSFGYGSRRDMDQGSGFIHDYCSFKVDQEMFDRRLFWIGAKQHGFPMDFEKSGVEAETWVFDEDETNSTDKGRYWRMSPKDYKNF